MPDRLNDAQLRAAAALRPGYATYPQYAPTGPERLGRLPGLYRGPACSHGYTVYRGKHPNGRPCDEPRTEYVDDATGHDIWAVTPPAAAETAPPVLDACPPAPAPPQPDYLLRMDRSLSDEDAAALKARLLDEAAGRGVTLAVLPPSPVFEFQPRLIIARPWWRRRWHWAVMSAGARMRYGYAWTEGGAALRTAREARRAAR